MALRIFQRGFNYSQDGHGNRLVYHLQGCNLHCPWCANPESMAPGGTWMDKEGGRVLSCRSYSVDALVEEAQRSAMLFFDGGGVTLTGGEPTLQWEALGELLNALHDAGIHTAMETNGTHPNLAELFPLVDQLILDCKHHDSERHRAVTGVPNEIIWENLARALDAHGDVLVRIPLVDGFNASEADAAAFAARMAPLPKRHAAFEFLTYHEYGKIKWEQCGMPYTMRGGLVSEERRRQFEQTFREAGMQVVRT